MMMRTGVPTCLAIAALILGANRAIAQFPGNPVWCPAADFQPLFKPQSSGYVAGGELLRDRSAAISGTLDFSIARTAVGDESSSHCGQR